mmetsp:Transcript_24368/g.57363  ORF Transcript_24368/g.57363 Transcript_24368/m.57363 type:complete len:257 (+) Transcript_24368:175-945(+)
MSVAQLFLWRKNSFEHSRRRATGILASCPIGEPRCLCTEEKRKAVSPFVRIKEFSDVVFESLRYLLQVLSIHPSLVAAASIPKSFFGKSHSVDQGVRSASGFQDFHAGLRHDVFFGPSPGVTVSCLQKSPPCVLPFLGSVGRYGQGTFHCRSSIVFVKHLVVGHSFDLEATVSFESSEAIVPFGEQSSRYMTAFPSVELGCLACLEGERRQLFRADLHVQDELANGSREKGYVKLSRRDGVQVAVQFVPVASERGS